MLWTTLRRIEGIKQCEFAWEQLLVGMGKTEADDAPLPYAKIVEYNNLHDATWMMKAETKYAEHWKWFAYMCVRDGKNVDSTGKIKEVLDVVERFIEGTAREKEIEVVWEVAFYEMIAQHGASPREKYLWLAWQAVISVITIVRAASRLTTLDAEFFEWNTALIARNAYEAAHYIRSAIRMAKSKAAWELCCQRQLLFFLEVVNEKTTYKMVFPPASPIGLMPSECKHEFQADTDGHPYCRKCGRYAYSNTYKPICT